MNEEINKIMEIPGNTKGAVILADLEYIRRKAGQESLDKIEEALAKLGHPIDFKSIRPFEEYKEAHIVSVYVLLRDMLGWSEEDIEKMGEDSAKISSVVRIFVKFVPFSKIVKEGSRYWSQHFGFGFLEVESNEVEKSLKVMVKGYNFHPLACACHRGYFRTMAHFLINGKDIDLKEVKCTHRGDSHHEYLITWK
ncbi:MAG: hypothetical protein KY054_02480 [Candidatus Nealsonbacteria bacterium]|nr:hypothetical protein [Candidatus Nealsonbacteria bacterium]